MNNPSQVRFVVIGSSDRQLEELLKQSGAVVSSQPLDTLASLAHAGSTAPDAIVVDLRNLRAVPDALAIVKRHNPLMGVVIVASELNPALMLEAMRAGVTEWVSEPVTASSLTDAIQRVVAQRAPKPLLGQVFAFVGARGGVGTTTVAVNVAAALVKPSRKALLVDLHLAHGDAALFLGAEPRFSTVDVLDNIHRLDEAFLKGLVTSTKSGIHLLASGDRAVVAATEPRSVRELIEFAAQRYAYVVLDVPHSDLTMLDSLETASSIILVANQELATVRRAGTLALSLRQRYGKDRVGVIINRYDPAADIGREDVERVTGGGVRHVIPSDYHTAIEGLNKGQPIVVQNHNRLAGSFAGLAQLLSGIEPVKPAKDERPAGLLFRLGMARS